MLSDAELLRRYADANAQDAFREFVERHLRLVFSAARQRLGGDAHRAADVTQQVFAAAAREACRLAAHDAIAAWLYATARNLAVDFVRRESARAGHLQEAARAQAELNDSPAPDWERLRPLLDATLAALPPQDREAILLRFFGAKPFREVGAAFRITEDAARRRVDRALERLRDALRERGVVSSAAALALALESQAAVPPTGLAAAVLAGVGPAAPASLAVKGIFMATTPKFIAAAAVAAVLATGLAVTEVQRARAAAADAAEEQARATAEHQRTAAALDRRAAAQAGAAVSAAAGPGAVPAATPRAASGAPLATGRRVARASGGPVAESATDAAYRTIEIERVRLHFSAEWQQLAGRALPFLARAGASREQSEAYAALASAELDDARFRNWFKGPWTVETFPEALQTEWTQKTRALLGAEVFERVKAYVGASSTVNALANYAAEMEIPLEPAQCRQLLDLLVTQPVRRDAERRDWETVYVNAGGFLSPAQVAAWRRWNELRSFEREVTAQFGAESAPTPATAGPGNPREG